MPSQKEKYSVGMAGEHFVVAELLRRGVSASVTMGNAKRADVVALNNDYFYELTRPIIYKSAFYNS